MVPEPSSSLDQRIAERVSALRAEQGLSLDTLARKCGVSRSTISVIERGETSPTAVVLERLATGLGVVLSSLFEPLASAQESRGPISRRADQQQWQDPASGYRRRTITPSHMAQPMRIVEVHFPARARVAFETGARSERVFQQVWMLQGAIDITIGTERHRLRTGDCLAMHLDRPTLFHNPTRRSARYAVVIASQPSARR